MILIAGLDFWHEKQGYFIQKIVLEKKAKPLSKALIFRKFANLILILQNQGFLRKYE